MESRRTAEVIWHMDSHVCEKILRQTLYLTNITHSTKKGMKNTKNGCRACAQ